MKGVPFLPKMVYERVRVGPRGGASPSKPLLSTPPDHEGTCYFRFHISTDFKAIVLYPFDKSFIFPLEAML